MFFQIHVVYVGFFPNFEYMALGRIITSVMSQLEFISLFVNKITLRVNYQVSGTLSGNSDNGIRINL